MAVDELIAILYPYSQNKLRAAGPVLLRLILDIDWRNQSKTQNEGILKRFNAPLIESPDTWRSSATDGVAPTFRGGFSTTYDVIATAGTQAATDAYQGSLGLRHKLSVKCCSAGPAPFRSLDFC